MDEKHAVGLARYRFLFFLTHPTHFLTKNFTFIRSRTIASHLGIEKERTVSDTARVKLNSEQSKKVFIFS